MRPRRTAIVPRVLLGTAVVGFVPLELSACGGTAETEGSNAGGASSSNPHGGAPSTGHAGRPGVPGGAPQGGGYIVLGGAFNGGTGANGNGGHAGTEVALAGASGEAAEGGEAGADPNGGGAGFIVLAVRAFGGSK